MATECHLHRDLYEVISKLTCTRFFLASWMTNLFPLFFPMSFWAFLVMEKCIFKYFYNFIHTLDILTPCQSGLWSIDPTVNQLLKFASAFYKAVGQGEEYEYAFFDISSKAFDKLWHMYSGLCRWLCLARFLIIVHQHQVVLNKLFFFLSTSDLIDGEARFQTKSPIKGALIF